MKKRLKMFRTTHIVLSVLLVCMSVIARETVELLPETLMVLGVTLLIITTKEGK